MLVMITTTCISLIVDTEPFRNPLTVVPSVARPLPQCWRLTPPSMEPFSLRPAVVGIHRSSPSVDWELNVDPGEMSVVGEISTGVNLVEHTCLMAKQAITSWGVV